MQFLQNDISPEVFIAAARWYLGIRYDPHHTVDGVCTDCAGFLLLTARRAGLLPPDCDTGFSPSMHPRDRNVVLAAMLRENFTEVPLTEALPGDLLRFKIHDAIGRHVAIKTSCHPAPHGSIIHAMNGRVTDTGAVFEQRIDPYLGKFLFKAYRLNQWVQMRG